MIYIINAANNNNNSNFKDISYQYLIQNNELNIVLQINYPDESYLPSDTFSVSINIDQYAGKYITIRLIRDFIPIKNGKTYSMFQKFLEPLINFDYSNLYDVGYSIKDIGSLRFLSLYITKNKQDIYIHPFFYINPDSINKDGYQYIEKEMINSDHLSMLTSSCQELREYIEKWNMKKFILNPNIDISKSATYLETEVDTLYKIINILLDKIKIDVSEYQPIIDAVERNNVLNIKNLEKLVSEIDEDKQNIRKQQKIYYDKAYKQ